MEGRARGVDSHGEGGGVWGGRNSDRGSRRRELSLTEVWAGGTARGRPRRAHAVAGAGAVVRPAKGWDGPRGALKAKMSLVFAQVTVGASSSGGCVGGDPRLCAPARPRLSRMGWRSGHCGPACAEHRRPARVEGDGWVEANERKGGRAGAHTCVPHPPDAAAQPTRVDVNVVLLPFVLHDEGVGSVEQGGLSRPRCS